MAGTTITCLIEKDLRGTEQVATARACTRHPVLPLPPGSSFPVKGRVQPRAASARRDRGFLAASHRGLLLTMLVPSSESENIVLALHACLWHQLVKWVLHVEDRLQKLENRLWQFSCLLPPHSLGSRVPSLRKVIIIHQETLCNLLIFACDKTRFAGLTSVSLGRSRRRPFFFKLLGLRKNQ